ncbi:hypothetical protein N665_0648s0029 [Sinapis alba]|nr:hypothetical protein N665_0648s0029 [Sinapis alba]KAF8085779.1 hypothetical protein N665_0648s0029 [Sinapis alba]
MAKDYVSSVPKFLLLLLILYHSAADSTSIIKHLPGFDGPLPFELETGFFFLILKKLYLYRHVCYEFGELIVCDLKRYVGVGEQEEVKLFYYFIKSERNPEEDPLLLWLSGGPGCSSISGLLFENGPLTVKLEVYNGTLPSLVSTTYSWTKISSILYVDQPVGTGFSYSSRTQLPNKPSDSGEVKRIHEFLHKWLGKHPEFFSNPFYVGGDSYSGMVVPALVQEISKGNYLCCKPPINLKGYVLGNPLTEVEVDYNHRIPFAHGMALISDELYESMKRICKGEYQTVDPSNTECLKLVEEYHKCIDRIYFPLILTPYCEESEDTSPHCYTYRYLLITYWANDENVRRALQIPKESKEKWVRCYWGIPYTHDIKSSVPYHMNNSISGYPSLIFRSEFSLLPFEVVVQDSRPFLYYVSFFFGG